MSRLRASLPMRALVLAWRRERRRSPERQVSLRCLAGLERVDVDIVTWSSGPEPGSVTVTVTLRNVESPASSKLTGPTLTAGAMLPSQPSGMPSRSTSTLSSAPGQRSLTSGTPSPSSSGSPSSVMPSPSESGPVQIVTGTVGWLVEVDEVEVDEVEVDEVELTDETDEADDVEADEDAPYGPGSHAALESHWFGGPRSGKHELESGSETVELQVVPSNCVQCGAITAKGGRLTLPEGGDGPLYQET